MKDILNSPKGKKIFVSLNTKLLKANKREEIRVNIFYVTRGQYFLCN